MCNNRIRTNGAAFKVMTDRMRVYSRKKHYLPILMESLEEIGRSSIPWLENRCLDFAS